MIIILIQKQRASFKQRGGVHACTEALMKTWRGAVYLGWEGNSLPHRCRTGVRAVALSWSPEEFEKQLLQIYVCLAIRSTLTECEGNTAAFGFAMEIGSWRKCFMVLLSTINLVNSRYLLFTVVSKFSSRLHHCLFSGPQSPENTFLTSSVNSCCKFEDNSAYLGCSNITERDHFMFLTTSQNYY